MQAYSDVTRADDAYALPNVEYWHHCHHSAIPGDCVVAEEWDGGDGECLGLGWYWVSCFPGCIPDGEPMGPFATEAECISDFQVQS